MDEMNQQYDRITNLLRSQAAPVDPGQFAQAYAIAPEFTTNLIKGQQQLQQQPIQREMDILKVFEAKKAAGDANAQQLDKKISLFTGGDPEGTAMFLQELHNDPDQIDPGNSYQVMTKLAGIAKRNGYQSPTIQAEKASAALGLQKTQSEINKNNAMAEKARSSAGESHIDPTTGEMVYSAPKKPMPATALKMQNEALDAIGSIGTINSNLDKFYKQIEDGSLDLGMFTNAGSALRNKVGVSTANSRNFESFKSSLEKMRNDSLRLNKGVQTEGDAVRAWKELIANINDEGVVKQRLAEIKALNERAAELQKLQVDQIRSNYGHDPFDFNTMPSVGNAAGDYSKLSDNELLQQLSQ